MTMLMCPKCKRLVPDKMTACPRCGYQIGAGAVVFSKRQNKAANQENVSSANNNQKSNNAAIFIAAIVIALVFLAAANTALESYQSSANDLSAKSAYAPVQSTTETSSVEEWKPQRMSIDLMAMVVRSELKNNGFDYEVYTESNTVVVNVWYDGVASGVKAAQLGDRECRLMWDEVRQTMAGFSGSILKTIREQGPENAHLLFNVLNDENLGNALLSIYDSSITYDVLS